MRNPSQSYGASLAIWDHTVLSATWHKWTHPALTPADQASTWFTYPGGMEGLVVLGSLIAARSGIKPTTAWSQDRHPNRYAIKPPSCSFVRGQRSAVWDVVVSHHMNTDQWVIYAAVCTRFQLPVKLPPLLPIPSPLPFLLLHPFPTFPCPLVLPAMTPWGAL